MHFIIDIREACKPKRTGKGQWTRGFVEELLTRSDISLTLLCAEGQDHSWVDSSRADVQEFPAGFLWHWKVAKALKAHTWNGTYMSTTSFIVPYLVGKNFPVVLMVHDLIAFQGEPHDRKATFIERMTLPSAIRFAKHIFCLTESTKHDLLKRFRLEEKKVTPIFSGRMRSLSSTRHSDGKTILCIATLCPRKNQKRLVEAFSVLPSSVRNKHQLVLGGARGWHDQDIVDLAKKTPGVGWRGHVNDQEYQQLLASCHVFALPSLYEGFGMQIHDALSLGIPVLTSNRGSLKEVAGDAALIVDPENTVEIAMGLEKLLTDEKLREELSEKGKKQAERFSWKTTVDVFLECVESRE